MAAGGADAEIVAVYELVLIPATGGDPKDLERVLAERREAIDDELWRRAVEQLGPAYIAKIGEWSPPRALPPWLTRARRVLHRLLRRPLPDEHVDDPGVRRLVTLRSSYPVLSGGASPDELRAFAGQIKQVVASATTGWAPTVAVKINESWVPAAEESPAGGDSGWDRVAPLLAAIGTSIGVIGFVTFVGGAVDWARFQTAGLPREEALSVVPTQDLIVVGARLLVPAVLAGLAGCAFYGMFWFHRRKSGRRFPTAWPRAVALMILIGAALLALAIWALQNPSATQIWVFLSVGVVAVLLSGRIAYATRKLPLLLLTIFVVLGAYLGLLEYSATLHSAKLRGAAVVRENKKAIVGFFIAESPDRVYLANYKKRGSDELSRDESRLLAIDKSQISDIAIGAPKAQQAALAQAQALAGELCQSEVPDANPVTRKKALDCNTGQKPGLPPAATLFAAPPAGTLFAARHVRTRATPPVGNEHTVFRIPIRRPQRTGDGFGYKVHVIKTNAPAPCIVEARGVATGSANGGRLEVVLDPANIKGHRWCRGKFRGRLRYFGKDAGKKPASTVVARIRFSVKRAR